MARRPIFSLLSTLALCLLALSAGRASGEVEWPVIGIDLGTTYSCVGVFTKGHVEIIANDQGNRITPSWVAWTDGERLVGEGAKNQAALNPANTIFDIKRLIGRNFDDPNVRRDARLLPYTVMEKSNKPMIEITDKNERRVLTPEEISAMILQKMKQTAEDYLGTTVTNAVITVPAYFNDAQRHATVDAGTIAGLNVLRVLNEPTAAAIAYGFQDKEEKTVLVYDLGGGTFDVSVLVMDNGFFEVQATNGDTHLGGEDFDHRIMKYIMDKFKRETNVDASKDPKATQRLRREVEQAKKALSNVHKVSIDIDSFSGGLPLKEVLTRAKFEELNMDLFKKTMGPVRQVLQDAKLEPSQIDEIVLVGGSTRIPRVQQLLRDFFGKEAHKGVNPDEAVAHGAALHGASLSGEKETQDLLLLDVAPLSLGIETVGGVMTVLIPRNSRVPARKSSVFSTYQDNQDKVMIQVFEGERSMTKDNRLLGNFDLSGIRAAPRGVPQIEVTFDVDVSGILTVKAEDKDSGKAKELTIKSNKGRLSQEEIDKMIREAEEHADEDRAARELSESRNQLENTIYLIKNKLNESPDSSDEDVKNVNKAVEETVAWIESGQGSSKEEYAEKVAYLNKISAPFFQKSVNEDEDANDDDDNDEL